MTNGKITDYSLQVPIAMSKSCNQFSAIFHHLTTSTIITIIIVMMMMKKHKKALAKNEH